MKVIITGSTGMIGKGVLLECLDHPKIEKILVINRRSLNMKHPKLKEILLEDFTKLESVKENLVGYDACFHNMGVSVVGLSEKQYTKLTFEVSRSLAEILYVINPNMTFIYVSGTGTDSAETGRSMWARVKGRTENYILNKGFGNAYMFRPGAIIPEKGIKSRTSLYNFFYFLLRPFFGLMKRNKNVTTTTKIGLAMINILYKGSELKYLENKEINELAIKV